MWFKRIFRKHSDNPRVSGYIQKHLGFVPQHAEYYQQAFRHSSAAVRDSKGIKNSNERLEFLGDAVLDLIVADYLYEKFPNLSEGELTKMKAKVVSRKTLNALGNRIKLDEQLELNLGNQVLHQSIVGNAFEALVGAIYLDQGFLFTQQVILKLLKRYDVHKKVHLDVDFKSKLHELCQKEKISLHFEVVDEQQGAGKSHYGVVVKLNQEVWGSGTGKSKKSAEQSAARQACARWEKRNQ